MKHDYYFFENVFSKESCDHIADRLEKDSKSSNKKDNPAPNTIKTATVSVASWREAKEYLKDFETLVQEVNIDIFGFDLYSLTDSMGVNYNVYDESNQGQYDWHNDAVAGEMSDIKLTAIANLSTKPYLGGDFELFLNCPRHVSQFDNPGSVLIFPSWIQHRVTPVTQGQRKTLSIWFKGPLFR